MYLRRPRIMMPSDTDIFPNLLMRVASYFSSHSYNGYLVGGAIRDALLGKRSGDIDIAVDGDTLLVGGELASHLGGRMVVLDRERGIVRVTVPDDPEIPFVDLTPIEEDINSDLARRDFTIDALALRVDHAAMDDVWSRVIDPGDGLSDLRKGYIRAMSPSVFVDDPARLLRAPRLAAQLGFEIDQGTEAQIRQNAHLVAQVAPERVKDELLKLLAEPNARDSIRALDGLELLGRIIPELNDTRNVTQPREHYWDVFNHLVETVGHLERIVVRNEASEDRVAEAVPTFKSMREHFAEQVSDGHSRLTLLKLAGLLHDISKPATKTVEDSGRIRFLGHNILGAETAEDIMTRLRISNRGVELVRLMVLHHLRPGQMASAGELPSGKAIFRYFRDVGDAAIDTVYLNMADYLAARGPELELDNWERHCRVTGHILGEGLERKAPDSLPKIIDGHDIMDRFSLQAGPQIGTLINLVQESQANGEIDTKEEALELVKANLDLGGNRA